MGELNIAAVASFIINRGESLGRSSTSTPLLSLLLLEALQLSHALRSPRAPSRGSPRPRAPRCVVGNDGDEEEEEEEDDDEDDATATWAKHSCVV